MIFYSHKNIKTGRFIDALENHSKISILPAPKKLIEKRFSKLLRDFAKVNNSKEVDKKLDDAFHKQSLVNRINNIYPSIYYGMQACYKIAALTGELPAEMKIFEALYTEISHRPCTIERIEEIPAFVEDLKQRFESWSVEPEPEPFDFEAHIMRLNTILHPIDMLDKRLITLQKWERLALKKQKQVNKNQEA